MTELQRDWFRRSPHIVAPELLGLVLVSGPTSGRIVEVESYGGEGFDAASHAHKGETPRTRTLFGQVGHLYVYFTYGMHHCANVVAHQDGTAGGVLIRALAPLSGLDDMRNRRKMKRPADSLLTSGPGRLCQALGLDRSHDGIDLLSGGPIRLVDDGFRPGSIGGPGPRVGIRSNVDLPARWWIADDPNVTRVRKDR